MACPVLSPWNASVRNLQWVWPRLALPRSVCTSAKEFRTAHSSPTTARMELALHSLSAANKTLAAQIAYQVWILHWFSQNWKWAVNICSQTVWYIFGIIMHACMYHRRIYKKDGALRALFICRHESFSRRAFCTLAGQEPTCGSIKFPRLVRLNFEI